MRACVRACVRACMRACVPACVHGGAGGGDVFRVVEAICSNVASVAMCFSE